MKKAVFIILMSLLHTLQSAQAQQWPPVLAAFDSLAAVYDRGMGIHTLSEEQLLTQRMVAVVGSHPEHPALQWRLLYYQAACLYTIDTDSAFRLLRRATALCKPHRKYAYDLHRITSMYGILQAMQSDHPLDKYRVLQKDVIFFQSCNDTLELANTYVSIGNLFRYIGDPGKALRYLRQAEQLFRQQHLKGHLYRNRLNIANVLHDKGQTGESMRILTALSRQPELRKDTAFCLEMYTFMAAYGGGRKTVEEYVALARAYGNSNRMAEANLSKAELLQKEGKPDSAIVYFDRVKHHLLHYHSMSLSEKVWHGLAQCYYQRQQWDSAAHYLYKERAFRDSVYHINLPLEMQQMESRTAIEKYELQLKETVETARFHRIIAGLLLLLTIVIGAGISYVFHSKRRKEQLLNGQYRLKVEVQNRELTAHTLMLNEKNRAMDSLLGHINKHEGTEGLDRKQVTELKAEIKAHLGTRNDWQAFKLQFEQVHPDFLAHLKQNTPTLTEGELHLCAYILTGMENKQIAQMLSLQPGSIKVARYRIRKKLELRQEESLEDYLRGIGDKAHAR